MIHADQLGHEALLRSGPAYLPTLEYFGADILGSTGEIDRTLLARKVFADPAALEILNGFVHPAVFAREEALLAAAPSGTVVVVEAAILIETSSYRKLDKLAVVYCSREQQIQRALQRPGATRQDVDARLSRQLPLSEKLRFADYTIDSSGTEVETLLQTQALFATLKEDLRQLCDSAPSS